MRAATWAVAQSQAGEVPNLSTEALVRILSSVAKLPLGHKATGLALDQIASEKRRARVERVEEMEESDSSPNNHNHNNFNNRRSLEEDNTSFNEDHGIAALLPESEDLKREERESMAACLNDSSDLSSSSSPPSSPPSSSSSSHTPWRRRDEMGETKEGRMASVDERVLLEEGLFREATEGEGYAADVEQEQEQEQEAMNQRVVKRNANNNAHFSPNYSPDHQPTKLFKVNDNVGRRLNRKRRGGQGGGDDEDDDGVDPEGWKDEAWYTAERDDEKESARKPDPEKWIQRKSHRVRQIERRTKIEMAAEAAAAAAAAAADGELKRDPKNQTNPQRGKETSIHSTGANDLALFLAKAQYDNRVGKTQTSMAKTTARLRGTEYSYDEEYDEKLLLSAILPYVYHRIPSMTARQLTSTTVALAAVLIPEVAEAAEARVKKGGVPNGFSKAAIWDQLTDTLVAKANKLNPRQARANLDAFRQAGQLGAWQVGMKKLLLARGGIEEEMWTKKR